MGQPKICLLQAMQRISWLKDSLEATMLQEDDACQNDALSSWGAGDTEGIQDQVDYVMSSHARLAETAVCNASVIDASLTARIMLNIRARHGLRVSGRRPVLALMQM